MYDSKSHLGEGGGAGVRENVLHCSPLYYTVKLQSLSWEHVTYKEWNLVGKGKGRWVGEMGGKYTTPSQHHWKFKCTLVISTIEKDFCGNAPRHQSVGIFLQWPQSHTPSFKKNLNLTVFKVSPCTLQFSFNLWQQQQQQQQIQGFDSVWASFGGKCHHPGTGPSGVRWQLLDKYCHQFTGDEWLVETAMYLN